MVCESETRTFQAFAGRRFDAETKWPALRLRLPSVLARYMCAFFPYHAQGSSASVARCLSHFGVFAFSFCDGDVCTAPCSDALRLRRGLTQAYVNLQAILSIDTLINCQRVHSVTVV